MASDNKESNILKFKKKGQLNIGLIIFGIIFIYLVATIVMYITAPHVTIYEVRQGSLLKDNAYTGLAIREEMVVKSDTGGYINYYIPESTKVKVGNDIYTLSDKELRFAEVSKQDELTLAEEEQYDIVLQIQEFNLDFQEAKFSSSYFLKNEIINKLNSHSSQSKMNQLSSMLSQENSARIDVYSSKDDGVVIYSVDGMEALTTESATVKHLDMSNYKKMEFVNNTKINPGENAYKLVTSDNWTVMIELTKETANLLQEKKYVKVHFAKDDQTMWADFEMAQKEGKYIGYLHFSNAMIRYATERYLDIELILEDETGLKIPKSAETEKEFYIVPKTYITQGGNNSENSVLRQTRDEDGTLITQTMSVNIYYDDDEIVYLDPNQFQEGDILIKENSRDTISLQQKRTLKGVYCINKGYAVFKQINILGESDTYYIVEEGNSYGLSNYDHIALDSKNIKENDVVF